MSDRVRLHGFIDRPDAAGLHATPHPDKAISQRATIVAALAEGVSRISNLADCNDVMRNLACLVDLGVELESNGSGDVEIRGRVPAAITRQGVVLDAGNSATTARFLTAVVAATGAEVVITGNAALRRRPMAEVVTPLRALGADITGIGPDGRLPIRVRGRALTGGAAHVEVDSAQPVSAALLAAAMAGGPSVVHRRVPARDHTERLLRWTGVEITESPRRLEVRPGPWKPFELRVPGDPSGAAYLAAVHLASAHRNRPLLLREVCTNPRRTGFFKILRAMGVEVELSAEHDLGPESVADISVRAVGPLQAVSISDPALVQSAIDELPMIAALAAAAEGETRIEKAAELRDKDTDRIATTVAVLGQFGVRARPTHDGLVVLPSPLRAPERVQLPNDHRLVFAGIVLALLAGAHTELQGVGAVNTSYPEAINELRRWVVLE
jgi:3-phosphoshikimate 1-carboxyvinyltransferase